MLTLVLQRNVTNVAREMDSMDVVRLVQQRTNHCFHAYASRLLRIMLLMDSIACLSVKHVPREANHYADFLAKLGNKELQGTHLFLVLTARCFRILSDDLSMFVACLFSFLIV